MVVPPPLPSPPPPPRQCHANRPVAVTLCFAGAMGNDFKKADTDRHHLLPKREQASPLSIHRAQSLQASRDLSSMRSLSPLRLPGCGQPQGSAILSRACRRRTPSTGWTTARSPPPSRALTSRRTMRTAAASWTVSHSPGSLKAAAVHVRWNGAKRPKKAGSPFVGGIGQAVLKFQT